MSEKWTLQFEVQRQKGQTAPYIETFHLEISPDDAVLDAMEMIWAFKDRSLCFGHACHHSTCGACGMRVNGVEKLTCITPIREVAHNGGTIRLQPLRNFPLISDLAVDLTPLYHRMAEVKHRPVLPVAEEIDPIKKQDARPEPNTFQYSRLADCIECGMCISACPAALTSSEYIGPAVLAGALQGGLQDQRVCIRVNSQNGAWRCHSAYECSEVCPSHVDPARRIMDLRKRLLIGHIRNIFCLR